MSMVDPSIDYLAEKVDSKYTLVILAAKRARELTKPAINAPEITRASDATIVRIVKKPSAFISFLFAFSS